jgi:hypothetical protein
VSAQCLSVSALHHRKEAVVLLLLHAMLFTIRIKQNQGKDGKNAESSEIKLLADNCTVV